MAITKRGVEAALIRMSNDNERLKREMLLLLDKMDELEEAARVIYSLAATTNFSHNPWDEDKLAAMKKLAELLGE